MLAGMMPCPDRLRQCSTAAGGAFPALVTRWLIVLLSCAA
jgi:hypothetical protein